MNPKKLLVGKVWMRHAKVLRRIWPVEFRREDWQSRTQRKRYSMQGSTVAELRSMDKLERGMMRTFRFETWLKSNPIEVIKVLQLGRKYQKWRWPENNG